MYKVLFLLLFSSQMIYSQGKVKSYIKIDYLNYADSLYVHNSLYCQSDTVFFGITPNYGCGVFTKTLLSTAIYSFGQLFASYDYKLERLRIYYGYSCMYVKMREDDYMDFLKENTQNGKWKEVNELKYSGKKAHLHSCNNAK